MPQSVQQPHIKLTSLQEYSTAIKNATTIERAVVMVESGKTVREFSRYLKAYSDLLGQVDARNKSKVHPALQGVHKELSAKLTGLEKRMTSAASKMGLGPTKPSVLGTAGTQISAYFANWTYFDIAKYSALGAAAALAAPDLWGTATRVPGVVATGVSGAAQATQKTVENLNQAIDLATKTLKITGEILNGVNTALTRVGFSTNSPSESPGSLGLSYALQLIAGHFAAKTFITPFASLLFPKWVSGMISPTVTALVTANNINSNTTTLLINGTSAVTESVQQFAEKNPLEAGLLTFVATWYRDPLWEYLTTSPITLGMFAGYTTSAYLILQAIEQVYPGFTQTATEEVKRIWDPTKGEPTIEQVREIRKFLVEKFPGCPDLQEFKKLSKELAKDGYALHQKYPGFTTYVTVNGLLSFGPSASSVTSMLWQAPGQLGSLGKGMLTPWTLVPVGCAASQDCRDLVVDSAHKTRALVANFMGDSLEGVKFNTSNTLIEPAAKVWNNISTYAAQHPEIDNSFRFGLSAQGLSYLLGEYIWFIRAGADAATQALLNNIPVGLPAIAGGVNGLDIQIQQALDLRGPLPGVAVMPREEYRKLFIEVAKEAIDQLPNVPNYIKESLIEGVKDIFALEKPLLQTPAAVNKLREKAGEVARKVSLQQQTRALGFYIGLLSLCYLTKDDVASAVLPKWLVDKYPYLSGYGVFTTEAASLGAWSYRETIRANLPRIPAAVRTYGPPAAVLATGVTATEMALPYYFSNKTIEDHPWATRIIGNAAEFVTAGVVTSVSNKYLNYLAAKAGQLAFANTRQRGGPPVTLPQVRAAIDRNLPIPVGKLSKAALQAVREFNRDNAQNNVLSWKKVSDYTSIFFGLAILPVLGPLLAPQFNF